MKTATITLPVDAATAEAYAAATAEQQRKIQLLLSLRLQELTLSEGRPLPAVMDEISDQAEARGLTPELLESLLHDE